MGKKHFCFFQTAKTGKRASNSRVKGSCANHYPIWPTPLLYKLLGWLHVQITRSHKLSPGEYDLRSPNRTKLAFSTANRSEGFNWLKTHPTIILIPHNQHIGHTWLIIAPYTVDLVIFLVFARRTNSPIQESRENYFHNNATKEKWKF